RGGAEIGGILLGRFEDQRLQILDYAPIECEHAFGPAFTLSPADQTRLGEMLRQDYPGGLLPVGWYHSHTRSEISLCEADLDIHNRYFPKPWQVALVLRPSTLQPTQAGFFFREPDGSVHAQHSYQEFALEALPVQPVRAAAPEALPGSMRETEPDAVVLQLHSAEAAEPAGEVRESAQVEPEAVPQPFALLAPPIEFPAVVETTASAPEAPSASAEEPAEPAFAWSPAREPEPEHEEFFKTESALPPASDLFAESRAEEHEPVNLHEHAAAEPAFAGLADEPPAPQRRWIGIAAGLVAGLGLGLFAGQARSHSRPAAPAVPPPVAAQRPIAPAPVPEDAALRKQNEALTRQVADLSQQNASLRKENSDLSNQQAGQSKQQTEQSKQQQAELAKQQADLSKQQ